MEKIDLSIVIPAYNEEKRIEKTLDQIYKFLKNTTIKFEIIVVDDGSTDLTASVVKKVIEKIPLVKLISYNTNMGKGEAVKRGVMASSGQLILFSDADLSTPISELEKLLPFIQQGYDIVIGSRRTENSMITKKQPLHRRISGMIFLKLVKVVLKLPFSDTQCGFKMFKGEIAKDLFSTLIHRRFIFDVEIIYKAYMKGYRIKEVGVRWANDPSSTVRFFSDSLECFVDLIKIRFGR
ncbi:MAG: glycosyltransferase family 2 protein [Candidatus Omnitrophica bacterium]|nr:glycosyltransferase family 2 protein [Candidatus Omnitrophota bacterium]